MDSHKPRKIRLSKQADLDVVSGLQGLTVGGEITLPSGVTTGKPMPGFSWKFEGDTVYETQTKNKEEEPS
jgi:hypothetical protein